MLRKYLLWVSGILLIFISIYRFIDAKTPKVGPIGNVPNEQVIWIEFILMSVIGILLIVLGFILFIVEKEDNKQGTKTILIIGLHTIMLLILGAQVITSPYLFVQIINLILVIMISGVIGALIRDYSIIRSKKKSQI